MNDEKGKIIQKLEQIMKLSLPYCKSQDVELSKIFYKINNLAYDVQKHLKSLDA